LVCYTSNSLSIQANLILWNQLDYLSSKLKDKMFRSILQYIFQNGIITLIGRINQILQFEA
jgi:hypothetical protein